jgi:hypothetical protein
MLQREKRLGFGFSKQPSVCLPFLLFLDCLHVPFTSFLFCSSQTATAQLIYRALQLRSNNSANSKMQR